MFTNFTKLCKGLALVLVVGHALVHFVPATVKYLALIPARYSSPPLLTGTLILPAVKLIA